MRSRLVSGRKVSDSRVSGGAVRKKRAITCRFQSAQGPSAVDRGAIISAGGGVATQATTNMANDQTDDGQCRESMPRSTRRPPNKISVIVVTRGPPTVA